jgi:hypothetical protein
MHLYFVMTARSRTAGYRVQMGINFRVVVAHSYNRIVKTLLHCVYLKLICV